MHQEEPHHGCTGGTEIDVPCHFSLQLEGEGKIRCNFQCKLVDHLGIEDPFLVIRKIHVAIYDFHESNLNIFERFKGATAFVEKRILIKPFSLKRIQVAKFRGCEVMPN